MARPYRKRIHAEREFLEVILVEKADEYLAFLSRKIQSALSTGDVGKIQGYLHAYKKFSKNRNA